VILPSGPCPSPILIVGEAPGAEEERTGQPFQGASGAELNRMLGEVGLNRSECFLTYLCRVRPPGNEIESFIPSKKKDLTPAHVWLLDRKVSPPVVEGYELLLREIELCKPKVIIALGNAAMWALTDKWGIKHWRGSQLFTKDNVAVIPTWPPMAVMRQWALRAVTMNDLRRAKRIAINGVVSEPVTRFVTRPTIGSVRDILGIINGLLAQNPTTLSLDIETSGGHIVCLGVAWTRADALCIPLSTNAGTRHYWTEWEEAEIVWELYRILTHPNARVIWQNGLFDSQYIFRHWHFLPRHHFDTMVGWHSCFSTLPKSLDFLASMLTEHYVQWKGISRELHSLKKED